MGIGRLGRLDDLLIGSPQASIGDVVPNRIVKEDRLLRDESDLIPQGSSLSTRG